MEIIDNISKRLGDDLQDTLRKGSRVDIISPTFSIYAYEALRRELRGVAEVRFVFSSPTLVEESLRRHRPKFYIPHPREEYALCGGEFELRLRNTLTQRSVAADCASWVRKRVEFRSNADQQTMPQAIIYVHHSDGTEDVAYINIDGFTAPDLGLQPKPGFQSMIQRMPAIMATPWKQYFDHIWQSDRLLPVTDKVLDYLRNAIQEHSPEFVYYYTLHHIFHEFLDDIAANALPNDRVGFKDSVVWGMLYNFQKDAVIGCINKLEKYNGCILADSVGLGKTFSALGVIKYYELRNQDVLVLCPKKLEANWNTYRNNDVNNILQQDRLRYDVLFHTDLSRERGMSNGRDLEQVNWGNYGLVVIDESHNFRNNNPNADRENRYQRLMRKVMQEGIETKVLMLSATPVNNRFTDLRNQLALAYEGRPAQLEGKLDTERSIQEIFKRSQKAFNEWSRLETPQRTGEKLMDGLDFDFFELLDSLTIARSRKHITTYYDTSNIGRFPNRNKPMSIRSPLTATDEPTYEYIAEQLRLLNLSIYTPLSYLLPSKTQHYADLYSQRTRSGAGSFQQADRERSLRMLMLINLLKRLESSVDSFRLTLQSIIEKIENMVVLLENTNATLEAEQVDEDDENFDWETNLGERSRIIGKRVRVDLADMDRLRWREDLQFDLAILHELWDRILDISPAQDTKLQALIELVKDKMDRPTNGDNRKLLIFTAFADTANYLYSHIAPLVDKQYQRHTALITGSRRQCTTKAIPPSLNTLLTCFSPQSKDKAALYPNIKVGIDVLIATDCISEGQNLQDCDYLVNYDIHWNPVRIIQRFGRIDRIGSTNEHITMVNFWPAVSLDAYINLKQRVENRMLIGTMTSTGDDNLLKQEADDLEYRKIQLQRLQDEVVDLEDLREGVSITDLGLNDFRVDLAALLETYGAVDKVPEGLHAVAQSTPDLPPGCIFVLKNVHSSVNIDKLNRLHPYYLVYIGTDETPIIGHVDVKQTLDAMRKLCKGVSEPLALLCKQISGKTKDYRDMSLYSSLLQAAIQSFIKIKEEKDVLSLFRPGGTTALKAGIRGLEDFKLLTFLIVR